MALCYQVRTIDKERLMASYGELPEGSLRDEIISTLADCLDIPYRFGTGTGNP